MSGGRVQPVSQGETRRLAQPLGVIRNARPMATATCGVDRSGESTAWMRRNRRVECITLQKPMTTAKDSTVARSPVRIVRPTEAANPGVASSRCQEFRPSVRPPRAGRKSKAGRTVAIKPAATGDRNSVRATAGKILRATDPAEAQEVTWCSAVPIPRRCRSSRRGGVRAAAGPARLR